jgi:hypothetical protein
MKNVVFWDITTCGSCKNRRLGGIFRLHHQGEKILLILFTLMMKALGFSETFVVSKATRCHIAEYGNLQSCIFHINSGSGEILRITYFFFSFT